MRNTTKLKFILQHYSIGLDMESDGGFKLSLVEKEGMNEMKIIEGKSYSEVIAKAFVFVRRKNNPPSLNLR